MKRVARQPPALLRMARLAMLAVFVAGLLVALPFGAGSGVAHAAEEDDARAHYRAGVELYGQARYAEALQAFERAYALHPTPGLLFNLGQTHYQLAHYAKALRALRTYLATAEKISAERRADVLEQLNDLKLKTGELAIFVDVPGATISVDDDIVAVSPRTEPILIDAGSHRVSVAHVEHVTAAHQVTVSGGEVTSLRVLLMPLHRGPDRSLETAAWITAGGLAALAVASAIVTVVQHSQYEDALRTPHDGDPASAQQALNHERAQVRGWALATDVLAVASLASCGVAVYARWQAGSEEGALDASAGTQRPANVVAGISTRLEF